MVKGGADALFQDAQNFLVQAQALQAAVNSGTPSPTEEPQTPSPTDEPYHDSAD